MSSGLALPARVGQATRDAAHEAGRIGRYFAQSLRLMVGLPDYGSYLAHMEATHPGAAVMSYEDFFRERQAARYGSRTGRCC